MEYNPVINILEEDAQGVNTCATRSTRSIELNYTTEKYLSIMFRVVSSSAKPWQSTR